VVSIPSLINRFSYLASLEALRAIPKTNGGASRPKMLAGWVRTRNANSRKPELSETERGPSTGINFSGPLLYPGERGNAWQSELSRAVIPTHLSRHI